MSKSSLKQSAPTQAPEAAYITPAGLTWALERSGLRRDLVAKRLKVTVTHLESWERGGSFPSFAKALELAKLLRVPFGFLFLPEPPSADLPVPDCRGFNRSYRPSPDLLELLSDTMVKQDWYQDYLRAAKAQRLKFVGSFSVKDRVSDVAADIRRTLGITQALRQSIGSWAEYLSTLTRHVEDAGILVLRSGVVGNSTKRKILTDELLGFAIAHDLAPIVFVNSADFKNSQVFTLAHELAHIWIGESALANPSELEAGHNTIEVFCNRVATEVLVPAAEFLNAWRHARTQPALRVRRLSRQFWVSTYVTLRRAHELGELTFDQYDTIRQAEAERRGTTPSSGGDYYRNLLARMSARFTNAVVGDVNSGKLPYRDAARLLDMKVPTLVRFTETWK